MSRATKEAIAAQKVIDGWRSNPVSFVRHVFGAEPDAWQADALMAVAICPKTAMAACKGPGKSCLLAWIIWWFLFCLHDSQIIAMSITGDNLKDNLWKELAVWQSKSDLLQATFKFAGERITNKERPATWWCSARSFAQSADPSQQANTLAGFHNPDCMIVLDELGDYPPGVLSAAEAIFANEDGIKKRLVCAGNPTRTDGPLYDIVMRPDGWHVVNITGDPDDPKRSPRISLDWARAEIAKWGRNNPWVMVNILGQFPPASSDQLISLTDVQDAMKRDVPALAYLSDARIWGLDPARFGDDESALMMRQGILARKARVWRNLDGVALANQIAMMLTEADENRTMPDAVFVDVGGVGSSVYDHLRYLGWDEIVLPCDFGSGADDGKYLNKRAEIWWHMAEWLKKRPACLPNDPLLQAELVAPKFNFRTVNKRTAFVLESKDSMKKRGVASPNRADALALTFTAPVMPRSREDRERVASRRGGRQSKARTEYDPFERNT